MDGLCISIDFEDNIIAINKILLNTKSLYFIFSNLLVRVDYYFL
jgi:hypothetical protein